MFRRISSSLILLLAICTERGFACSCPMPPPPCYAYGEADAVFVGTVIDSRFIDDDYWVRKTVIKVDKDFKNASGSTLYMEQVGPGNSCDLSLTVGAKKLFYGWLDPKVPGRFSTSYCTRTASYQSDLIDFNFLDLLSKSTSSYQIAGTVGQMKGLPAPDIKVDLLKEGKMIATGVSKRDGSIDFKVSEPGTYTARVWMPRNSGLVGGNDDLSKIKKIGKLRGHRFAELSVTTNKEKCGWFNVPLGIVHD